MWLKPGGSLLGNVLTHGPAGSEHLEIGFSQMKRLQVNLIGANGGMDQFYCDFVSPPTDSDDPEWRFLGLVVDVGAARKLIYGYPYSSSDDNVRPCTDETLAAYEGGGAGPMNLNRGRWIQFEDGMSIDDLYIFKRPLTELEVYYIRRGSFLFDHTALVSRFPFHIQQEWAWSQYARVAKQVAAPGSFFVDTSGQSSMFRMAHSSLIVTGSAWRLQVNCFVTILCPPAPPVTCIHEKIPCIVKSSWPRCWS